MPRVPTYSNLQVVPGGGNAGRVSSRGAQGLANVQGAQLRETGQAVQQVGGLLHAEVERQQDRINRARVQEATLKYREELAEAEREYQEYKGAELVAGDKPIIRDIEARIEQSRTQMMQSLSSPAAQRAFEEISMDMSGTWRQRAAGYEAEQAEFYIGQQRDGAIVAQVETGIADPYKRATSFQSAGTLLREKFEDQGFDGDRLNQKTQEAMGELLSGQIGVLLDADRIDDAQGVLEAAEGMVSASAYESMSTAVSQKAFTRDVNDTSDMVWSESEGDYGTALKMAGMIENPEKQEAVMKRLNALRIRDNNVRSQAEAQAETEVWGAIEQASNAGRVPSVNDIPRDAWETIGPQARIRIENWMAGGAGEGASAQVEAQSELAYNILETVYENDPELYMLGPDGWAESSPQLAALYESLTLEDRTKLSLDRQKRQGKGYQTPEITSNYKQVMAYVAFAYDNEDAMKIARASSSDEDTFSKLQELEGHIMRYVREWTASAGGGVIDEATSRDIIRRAYRDLDSKKFSYMPETAAFLSGAIDDFRFAAEIARNRLGREPTIDEAARVYQQLIEASDE
jgi:hypothetical protein